MSLSISKNNLTVRKELFSQIIEHPVDLEFIIPDYCTDIARILKCKGNAKIISKSLVSGRLILGGMVSFNIIYIDSDDGNIKSYQTTSNFTHELEVQQECDGGDVCVNASVDYMNCRTVTSRKLDVHGAVSINVRILKNCDTGVVTKPSEKHIQALSQKLSMTKVLSVTERSVIINEEIEAGPNLSGLQSVIRSDGCAIFGECKTVTNKAIVKGTLGVRMLCSCAKGELKKNEISIPFSQVLDAPGVDDQCECDVSLDIVSLEARTRTGMDGECKSISVSASICITLTVTKTHEETIVTDAFSTEYDSETITEDILIKTRSGNVSDNFVANCRVDFPEPIVSIADVWCETKYEGYKYEEGALSVSGMLYTEMIAFTQDASPVFIEKASEFTHVLRIDTTEGNIDIRPKLVPVAAAYTISDATSAEIRAEIQILMPVYTAQTVCVVTGIEADTNKKKTVDKDISLVVYFARKGESIWQIARRYNTSSESINSANELSDMTLESDRMLLIPIV